MGLLNKLTIKNLKLNKKRTLVTIIGIMLSVALITAVATMYSSAITSLIEYEAYEKGDFHVAFYNVPTCEVQTIKNNRKIENIFLTEDIGYSILLDSQNKDKPYAFIKAFTKSSLENLSIKLTEGRLPENAGEIVIPTHLKTNGRVILNIGDTITLDVGKRVSIEDNYELNQDNVYQGIENEEIINTTPKTYKIVGIIKRPATNIESYTAPGYTFITYLDEQNISGNVDVYAKYTKEGSKDYLAVTANILGVSENAFTKMYRTNPNELNEEELNNIYTEVDKGKYEFNINTYLIELETSPLNNSTVGDLGKVVGIVCLIIVFTSVFCIKNSFDISITEKIKQYGMLRSIGATKKQIKHNVFYEATILGLIGIPLGLALGFLASYILIIISNALLENAFAEGLKLVLSYSWVAFAVATILGVITIYFSAFRSAKRASKVTPIDSIRNSANIKIKSKKIRSPKIIKKIFGIGGEISYKNLKRNKKKYRTTVISIIVSTSIFIALSFFISSAFDVVKDELNMYDYNLSLHKSRLDDKSSFETKAMETVKLDNILDYAIYKNRNVYLKTPKYNEEYIKLGNYDEDYLNEYNNVTFITIGDYQYKKYLKSLNLDYDKNKDKGILVDYQTIWYENNKGKKTSKSLREFTYKNGDVISIYNDLRSMDIEIITTNTYPFGLNNDVFLIVSDEIYEKMNCDNYYEFHIAYKSSNASKLQDEIDTILAGENYNLLNIEENAKIMQNLYMLIAIFLYGFIIVISLIGITNIFNTITACMELRRQEFAMLKSIGMTRPEFSSMIRLESIFMGFKALIIGIPIGVLLSYLIFRSLMLEDGLIFTPPYLAIVIVIIVVYLLITILMKYSMNKIDKQNTIETIRNENI